MKILLTGATGFVGMHVAQLLLARGDEVLGLDNLNDSLPGAQAGAVSAVAVAAGFSLCGGRRGRPHGAGRFVCRGVLHACGAPGGAGRVRYSLQNPRAYVQSTLVGFGNVLEACRQHAVQHLVYASSSSVYGANREMPFSLAHNVDHPVSLYAASKKANELMAHSYSHLFNLPTTGLRYFTVYGPWGWPDMAPWLFTSAPTASDSQPVTPTMPSGCPAFAAPPATNRRDGLRGRLRPFLLF